MRPGVVTVANDAPLLQVQRAMIAHGVPCRPDRRRERPVGWITAGGLIPWLGQEPALYPASSALSETVVWIAPRAATADALRALADSATTHLVVSPRADAPANGVVSETDLVRLASGV
jgi:CBS domain-containing protein